MTKPATWLLVLVLLGVGCGKKSSGTPADGGSAATSGPAKPACDDNDDCPRGKVCFLDECVDTSSREEMLRHKSSATPDKVRRELEKQTEVRQKQLDRGLDMDE